MNNFFKTFHSTPTSCVPFIFGQTGLEQVQVTPKIVMLQPVADGLHLGQLLQECLVLLQQVLLVVVRLSGGYGRRVVPLLGPFLYHNLRQGLALPLLWFGTVGRVF